MTNLEQEIIAAWKRLYLNPHDNSYIGPDLTGYGLPIKWKDIVLEKNITIDLINQHRSALLRKATDKYKNIRIPKPGVTCSE